MNCRRWACFVVVLASLCGCGKYKLVPVEGTVTLDDQPVTHALVMFMPDPAGTPPAVAFTEEDGRFRLRTSERDGAVPGDYKVLVIKREGLFPPGSEPPADFDQVVLEMQKAVDPNTKQLPRSSIPEAYGKATKTPLTCTVPAGGPVALTLSKSAKGLSEKLTRQAGREQ